MKKFPAGIIFAVFFAIALIAGIIIFSSANAPASGLPSFWDAANDVELADRIIAQMTDEELLSQILMFGWAGLDPSPLVTDWVEKRDLGSIKIFGWNTDDTKKVAESVAFLQKKAAKGRFKIPLLVATDQEGGWIRHIKGRTSQTPGNLAIGASGLPMDAWYSGYYISRELRALGINLNFAPTVDLYTDHESTVIGPRSFGEDPESAGILGAAFSAGSAAAGMMTTAKHFPGHGDTGLDSHGYLPVISISAKTLRNRELVPFRHLIDGGVTAVMSGHLSFPVVTGNHTPATFSRFLLEDILRKELNFQGLIITDDIMMNGATQFAGSVSRAVQMAIEAGNDIVESSTTPHFSDALWTNTVSRMQTDEAFKARVTESARRVLLVKLAYFKSDTAVPLYPDMAKIEELVPDREGQQFFLSQAVRSVTLLREKDFPINSAPDAKVLAGSASAGKILIASNFPEFLAAGAKRFPDAEVSGVNWQLRERLSEYDTIIFCLANRDNLEILQSLRWAGKRIIVVSALSPVLLEEIPWAETVLAVYSYSPWSFQAGFAAIAGDFEPTGSMPIKGIQ